MNVGQNPVHRYSCLRKLLPQNTFSFLLFFNQNTKLLKNEEFLKNSSSYSGTTERIWHCINFSSLCLNSLLTHFANIKLTFRLNNKYFSYNFSPFLELLLFVSY